MILLDAYALEAYLLDEPAAAAVEELLLSGEQVVINAVNFAETFDRLIRIYGWEPSVATADIQETGCTIIGLDPDLAFDAATLRARHYHRSRRAVSIADCCAAAHALDRGARIATSDPALIDLVVAEGGRVEILVRVSGERYDPHRPESR
jgi:PIN domain nuclease of toxin-antitoxin system